MVASSSTISSSGELGLTGTATGTALLFCIFGSEKSGGGDMGTE